MLKQLISATLCTALGCASAEKKDEKKPVLIELPESSVLYVNDSFPHYYAVKTQEDGEADLEKLVRTAAKEEAWVFFPDINLWVEVGRDEGVGSVSVPSAALDSGVFYHIHPVSAYKTRLDQAERFKETYLELQKGLQYASEGSPSYERVVKSLELLKSGWRRNETEPKLSFLPSPGDMLTIAGHVVCARIASEYGVTEIKCISGIKNEKERELNAIGLQAAYVGLNLVQVGADLLSAGVDFKRLNILLIERLNDRFKGELEFKFRPWK